MKTCRVGLLLVGVLASTVRKFNLYGEKQHIQSIGCEFHRNKLCSKGTQIARGKEDEDNINTYSLSNHNHLLWLLYIVS